MSAASTVTSAPRWPLRVGLAGPGAESMRSSCVYALPCVGAEDCHPEGRGREYSIVSPTLVAAREHARAAHRTEELSATRLPLRRSRWLVALAILAAAAAGFGVARAVTDTSSTGGDSADPGGGAMGLTTPPASSGSGGGFPGATTPDPGTHPITVTARTETSVVGHR